jgi:hypothetical protein
MQISSRALLDTRICCGRSSEAIGYLEIDERCPARLRKTHRSTATTPASMGTPARTSAVLLQRLSKLPSRQCRALPNPAQRCIATRTRPCRTARPPISNPAAIQQRGYKYKTVEEAKSRYRAGVSSFPSPDLRSLSLPPFGTLGP